MNTTRTILISGWGANSAPMDLLATAAGLENHRTLTLCELRSLGEQNPVEGASDYAAGLLAVLAGEPAHVVGWSTGGIVALETVGLRSDLLQTLTLLGTTPKFCADEDFPHGTPVAAVRAMLVGLRRDAETILQSFAVRMGEPLALPASEAVSFVSSAMNQGVDELRYGLAYLRESDVRDVLRKVQVPCLLVHGRQDRIVPVEAAEWLHTQLPQSQLTVYEDAGHALVAHSGVALAARLRGFLGEDA